MGNYQYEWWTVEILYPTGRYTCEFKGRSRETIVRQINREAEKSNSPENLAKRWNDPTRKDIVKEVFWDTLKLDRVGYQRRF